MKDVAKTGSEEDRKSTIQKINLSLTQRLRVSLLDVVTQLAAAGALIIVFIYLSFASPVFLSFNNLFNIVAQTTVTAVIAIGMTFVIVSAGIDLSVGSTAALAGVIGVTLMLHNLSWPLAVVVGVLIGGLVGIVNGLLVTRARLSPFITTLGMMSVARGVVYISTNAVAVYGAPDNFALLGQGIIGSIPIPLIILVVVAVMAHFILSRTRLGRYTYAYWVEHRSSSPFRYSRWAYLTAIYLLQGLLAGFAGMIASSRVTSGQPSFGIGLELDVIAAVVVGGASLFGGQGTIIGTLIGAFLIALIRNGAVLLNVNIFYQNVIIGVVIWLAVFWDQLRRQRLATVSE